MTTEDRLKAAAIEFLASTDTAYDDSIAGISTLDRIIVGTPAILTPQTRGYLVPILYAYWERFFRIAFGEYLRCISLAQVPVQDLNLKLAVLRISSELKSITETHKFKEFHELCRNRTISEMKSLLARILFTAEQPAEFLEPSKLVKTYSNVEFETLEENCQKLGIDPSRLKSHFHTKSLFMSLKDLVDMRNSIAHGSEFKSLSATEWEAAKDFVVKVILVVQLELSELFSDTSRLLNPTPSTSDFQI